LSRGAKSAYGGLVLVHFEQTGRYRISLDAPAWVDVVEDGKR
jgi:hypothetical protein